MMKHKNKFIAAAAVVALLAGAWFWGSVPETNTPTPEQCSELAVFAAAVEESYETQEPTNLAETLIISDEAEDDTEIEYNTPNYTEYTPYEPTYKTDYLYYNYTQPEPDTTEDTLPETSTYDTVPEVSNQDHFAATPEGVITPEFAPGELQIFAADHPEMRAPVEPEDMEVGDGSFTVTLSVRAHTILYNMHLLHRDKYELVPEDGWIFPPTQVTAYEGESVFNVLQREMRRNRIHMVSRWTPIFNSAYVEAINNLFEFDVGPLSGWMYRVNDWFPNFGASRYLLSDGDVIEWIYTVDLGRDLGVYWLGGDTDSGE